MKKRIFALVCTFVLVLAASGCGAAGNSAAEVSASASESPSAPASESPASGEPASEPAEPVVEEPPPDNSWEFDRPESHGVDPAILENLYAAVADTDLYAILIAKDGVVINEYYKDGYDENSVFRFASCTKSFSGALIGLAIENGFLSGVDAKLTEFFSQLADSDDALKKEITVEHLLTHTSGIYWSEWNGGPMFRELSQSENWVEFVLGQPMASEPGTVFNYTTGGSHLLGAVIQEATGQTAFDFGKEYLFGPMGMDSVEWRSDPQGVTDGGNGISMTARDAAKFGQLYLDGGEWKGRRIISEAWVEESVKTQAAGSWGTGEYGYSWWLKAFGTSTAHDVYYAMGHGGQYIFVVPEFELVVVMASRFQDTYAPQYFFNDYLIPACE